MRFSFIYVPPPLSTHNPLCFMTIAVVSYFLYNQLDQTTALTWKMWLINRLLAACGFVLFLIRWDSTCCTLSGVSVFFAATWDRITVSHNQDKKREHKSKNFRSLKWPFSKMTLSEQSPWEGGLCVCVDSHTLTQTTGSNMLVHLQQAERSGPIRHNDKHRGNNVSYLTRLIFVLLMLARFLCMLVQLGLKEGQSRCVLPQELRKPWRILLL